MSAEQPDNQPDNSPGYSPQPQPQPQPHSDTIYDNVPHPDFTMPSKSLEIELTKTTLSPPTYDEAVHAVDNQVELENKHSFGPDEFSLDRRPAHDLMDDVKFPNSTALYRTLCEQFGPGNVSPLPQWLSKRDPSDKIRLLWYKSSNGNSLLYFLYKSPKYRKAIQEMLDQGNYVCSGYDQYYTKHSQGDSSCCVCCVAALPVFCCGPLFPLCFYNYEFYHYAYYGLDWPKSQNMPFCESYDCCITLHGEMRTDFFDSLEQAGFQVSKPQYPCLYSSFCSCFASNQYQAILGYYVLKRYGAKMDPANNAVFGPASYNYMHFDEFYNAVQAEYKFDVKKEPLSRQYPNPYAKPTSREPLAGRWRGYRTPYRAFREWYDLDGLLTDHNKRWAQFHHIKGPLEVKMA